MQSVLFKSESSSQDSLVAKLWEQGTTGIIEEAGGMRAFFNENADLSDLFEQHRNSIIEVRTEQSVDWQQVSREGWDPILVGQRFFVAPPWVDEPTPAGRMRLVFDSIQAFGTGRHESTQLAIEALERYLEPGQTVVDVGCGTGILSVAAEMLGADHVFACDVDPCAAAEAQQRVPSRVFVGSAEAIKSSVADVVLANIICSVIERIGDELRRLAKPGGVLILGGFIAGELPSGFEPDDVLRRGDWICWIVRNGPRPD